MSTLRAAIAAACVVVGAFAASASSTPAAVGANAPAAHWKHCGSVTSGDYRARGIRALRVKCTKARAVARHFHDYPIGSSGATYVRGYGCAYRRDARVQCGSGASGRGPKKIRWRETR